MENVTVVKHSRNTGRLIATLVFVAIVAIFGGIYVLLFGTAHEQMIEDLNELETTVLSKESAFEITHYYSDDKHKDYKVEYSYDGNVVTFTNPDGEVVEYSSDSSEFLDFFAFTEAVFSSSREGIEIEDIDVMEVSNFYLTKGSESVLMEGSWRKVYGTYGDKSVFNTYVSDDGKTLIEDNSDFIVVIELKE